MRQAASQARQRLDCGDLSPLLSTERKPSRPGFDRAASKSASKLAHSKRWRATQAAVKPWRSGIMQR